MKREAHLKGKSSAPQSFPLWVQASSDRRNTANRERPGQPRHDPVQQPGCTCATAKSRKRSVTMAIRAGFKPTTGTEVGDTPENQTTRRILVLACVTCLTVAATASVPQPAPPRHITPPPVLPDLQVDPAKNEA